MPAKPHHTLEIGRGCKVGSGRAIDGASGAGYRMGFIQNLTGWREHVAVGVKVINRQSHFILFVKYNILRRTHGGGVL